jgi:hypothetical protein
MPFATNARVRVSSQNSAYREKLGTVEIPAASSEDNLNKVRIDGYPRGKTVNLADEDLSTTTFAAPVQY